MTQPDDSLRRHLILLGIGLLCGLLLGVLWGKELGRQEGEGLHDHWRDEISHLAIRVQVLESSPKLAVMTAPVGDVILPGGILEHTGDGRLRLFIPRARELPGHRSTADRPLKSASRVRTSTADRGTDGEILEGDP